MGDAQSAQRENKKDAAAEEESGQVDDARAEQNTEEKPLKNNGQISEINGKADSTIAEVNGHCEDEIAAEAILSPEDDVLETAKPLKEETPLETVEINQKESPNEAEENEEGPLDITEMDAKQNDINEGFRRFFSNIGLKLTVKRGSAEKADLAEDVPDETNEEETNRPEYIEGTTNENKSENTEQNTDLTTAKETYDNDSTTCPTMTDATSEDVLENAEEKTTEAKEEVESAHVDEATTSPEHEDEKAKQDTTPEEDLHPTSPTSPETEVVSPIKRFFTTGIFSGLRKKKKPTEDETTDKELVEMGKDTVETAEKTSETEQDKEEVSVAVEAETVEMNDGKSPSTDEIVNEPEITNSQEKVQASPLKRLLSGSKKRSKKQKGRKSGDAKLSDSGEHFSDQVISSTESAEHQKVESPAPPTAEPAGEEDSAWASFKKLVTPKKRTKANEETQIQVTAEETKPSEEEHISDRSTEEGKKRKDSTVSWEAVLCGSGRRRSRSRKTSDSEDETPQAENKKQDSPLESSNEADEILANSPQQEGSPSEGDGGSTWKSLKKLVTPKRKAKDEEETKDNIQSDSEVPQDDSSFSIKKLIPGRKKRKSVEKQDQVSSDEADREVVSGDEDSETPAVVPLSEFDTTETEVQIKTQADIESHVFKDADDELQQGLLDQMAEAVPPRDSLQTEAKKAQDNEDTVENEAAPIAASDEEPEDLTESISKHQQLSDIPEEGIITDTMATPASVTEEAARDDTIAEDLIEITSEAITAPEPVDITMTDETEMISAVSQLSESSKTSGNTTPVPVEYDVKHTDELLHQVVETIYVSPTAAPLCSEDVGSERIAGSVSPQILESFVKEQPAILEIHKRSDATAITIGLNVEELEVIDELAATAQTESISEVNEGVSTEIVSEVLTMQVDTAEAGVDEVHEVSVSEESIKELERPVEVESQSEVNEDVSTETVTEGEETVADEDSLVGAQEATQVDSQEAEPASTVAGESEDGGVEQEIEDRDQAPVEMEEIAAVQASKSEEDVIPEEMQEDAAEIEAQKTQEEIEPVTQDNVEVEREDELQADAAATEPADVPEVLEEVVPTTPDSEDGKAPSPQGEALSEDIPTVESVIDETIHETENLSVELKSDTIDNHQNVAEEVLQAVQEPTIELEEGTAQSPEKDIISEVTPEVTPAAETVSDELKEESEPLAEDNEPVDAIENEQVQEPEAAQEAKLDSEEGSAISLEKEVISEEIPPTDTVEVTQVPESSVELEGEPSVEDAKADHVQESEEITSDGSIAPEAEAEVEASLPADVVTESVEEGSAQEGQILSEDVSQQETVTSETESKVEEVGQALEINDQKAESIAQSAQTAQEDHVTEVVNELETLSAVHLSSINEGECIVQVGEKTLISEVMPDSCVDNAVGTHEPEHEVHASAAVASVEGDKEGELPGVEIQTAPVEHALVTQVITCYLKDVSSALPDVLIEKSSDSHEPLIDTIANEQELEETVITTTPLVKDEVFEKAEEGSVVMMMNVPSVQFEDNHRIQVQVVDVDIKSAETIVDTVLEVGVTETKEVIDVCHETVEEVDTQYVTSKTEELINQESKVTIEEPVQLVKEKLSEPVPESVPVNLEQTEVSEIVEQQVSEDLQQTPDVPGSVDVSVQEHKEDLEEPKAELEKSEAVVKTEEVKLPSEELHMKTNEEAQIAQIAQSQIATPSNTALVVPQNTGIVSSIGNVESPSSLSLEFKLNIQFGQTRAPASPPPPPPPPPPVTERIEPVKKAEVSEVGVQAVEPEKQIIPAQSPESQKQTESSEVAVQATEITEPVPADITSPKRAVVINQPVLLDVGRQAMERVEPAEQIKPTEEVPPDVQATETIQTVKQTEKQEEVLSQPVLSEACEEETEAKEPVKQTEEENDQDVWLDAEEDIYTQTQVPLPEVEELQEQQPESDQDIKAEPQQESDVGPNSKTEEEESQQEPLKTGATYEIESESEDFAVALEQPEAATATTTITPTEWD